QQILAGYTCCFAQPYPGLYAVFLCVLDVVMRDALHPFAACVAVGTICYDRSVFLRYAYLVVITVRHPGADLVGSQLAFVHPYIEGMMNMIASAFRAQLRFELLAAPGGIRRQRLQSFCGF